VVKLAEAYPLAWPASWPRTDSWRRRAPRFGKRTLEQASRCVYVELERLKVKDTQVVISTNLSLRLDGRPAGGQRSPADPGVAVYFVLKDKPHVLACDRWSSIEHNLYAIALHIGALRGMERWGVGSASQAFAGYRALPENAGADVLAPWRAVLGEPPAGLSADWIRGRDRELAKDLHPDVGGSNGSMAALTRARDDALLEAARR